MEILNTRMSKPIQDDSAITTRKGQFNPFKWVSKREITGRLYGSSHTCPSHAYSYSKTKFYKGLYNSFGHGSTWNNASGNPYHYGAIFNFDFTPDG